MKHTFDVSRLELRKDVFVRNDNKGEEDHKRRNKEENGEVVKNVFDGQKSKNGKG